MVAIVPFGSCGGAGSHRWLSVKSRQDAFSGMAVSENPELNIATRRSLRCVKEFREGETAPSSISPAIIYRPHRNEGYRPRFA